MALARFESFAEFTVNPFEMNIDSRVQKNRMQVQVDAGVPFDRGWHRMGRFGLSLSRDCDKYVRLRCDHVAFCH
jgi:hypothetical protein